VTVFRMQVVVCGHSWLAAVGVPLLQVVFVELGISINPIKTHVLLS
jgi:hypothetical protein